MVLPYFCCFPTRFCSTCCYVPGDEVISINDQPTEGWTGDMAAKLLRGKGGTEVRA